MPKKVDWVAVGAAIVDEEKAAWSPPRDEKGHPARPWEWFTRAHIELLRDCGATRADVLDYAGQYFSPRLVAKLASDLGSYGL